jgi:hypothetical protein
MRAGAIFLIAVAATGMLMMRFRKRWLAKINIAFTNRFTGRLAAGFRVSAFSRMWGASQAGFIALQ